MSDVTVVECRRRRGKTAIVNDALRHAVGEIVVFTDANVMLEPSCLVALVAPFTDPSVGCVQGQLTYANAEESSTARNGGLQWRYEEFLKREESRSGSVMGADGSVFAIRRLLFSSWPEHVLDDFTTSMRIVGAGHRMVFAETARAVERSAVTAHDEFQRKIRIATRAVRSFIELLPYLGGLGWLDWLKLLSHKVMRWGTGVLMAVAFIANVALLFEGGATVYVFTFSAQVVVFLVGGGCLAIEVRSPASWLPPACSSLGYFLLSVLATTAGALRALRGATMPYWTQAPSAR
jgi:cellulose synthase/poly-beta-1,6-N-acetylglucosamine synthase-like glycosyltransferase